MSIENYKAQQKKKEQMEGKRGSESLGSPSPVKRADSLIDEFEGIDPDMNVDLKQLTQYFKPLDKNKDEG